MERHTTPKRWLIVLVILFAPPFLVVGAMWELFWLLYPLFPSASFLAWLGIEGYAAIVLGAHVLISTGLMWLLVRRRERSERWPFVLTGVAIPLAMPFLAFWPLSLLRRLSYRLFPSISSTQWWFFGTEAYRFLSTALLSDVTRYVILSLVALILSLAALTWLAAQERNRIWRRGRFYLLAVALVGVLAFPLLMRYQPVVKAAPGVELRLVDEPGLLDGVVKSCQAAAEISGCQYEPLGWANAQTLVYRKWCGGHYDETGVWHAGSPGAPLLYDVRTGRSGVSLADHAPSHETCAPAVCVSPMLAGGGYFPPLHYLPGHFKDPVISPDGRWVAFTARHVYGPEDLLVISNDQG